MKEITNYITTPALLEQCAEEAAEFAQSCLKLARKFRGENPTPKKPEEILIQLHDETADMMISIDSLVEKGVVSWDIVNPIIENKYKRWQRRIKENNDGL